MKWVTRFEDISDWRSATSLCVAFFQTFLTYHKHLAVIYVRDVPL